MVLKVTKIPFPISNHDVIRHIKNITKEFFENNNFKCLRGIFK
jgi:hypothetical protein